tara:strand:+ start:1005 stop:1418 length:414 start_codon:yes stop_codon:yes gene_type:complete
MVFAILPDLQEKLVGRNYEPTSTSYAGLKPGDLIQFSYAGALRQGFIIGSDYKPYGLIYSSRGRSLNYILLTDGLGGESFDYLLNTIYGNENNANYDFLKKQGFTEVVSNFRTMQLMGIRSILKLNLTPEDGNPTLN